MQVEITWKYDFNACTTPEYIVSIHLVSDSKANAATTTNLIADFHAVKMMRCNRGGKTLLEIPENTEQLYFVLIREHQSRNVYSGDLGNGDHYAIHTFAAPSERDEFVTNYARKRHNEDGESCAEEEICGTNCILNLLKRLNQQEQFALFVEGTEYDGISFEYWSTPL